MATDGPPSLSSSGGPRIAGLAVATAGTLAAFEVAGRAARDGYYLSELPAASLPFAISASAFLALIGTLAMSAWMRRSTPQRIAPLSLAAVGTLFVALAALGNWAPRASAATLYLHMTGIVPVVLASFWAVINERFDPYTAKSVVARMAAAGALGGVVGGVAAERVAALLGIPALLLALAALCAAAGLGTRSLAASAGAVPPPELKRGADSASGFRSAARHPLLRNMAVLMLSVAVAETFVDYALKVEAAASFESQGALVRFFAVFYVGCGLLSFIIQLAVGDRMLRRLGIAGAVAVLPASVAAFGAMGAVTSRLWVFALARGAETVASLAFFRGGFQLLYTPISPEARRPAKPWVDVAAGSAGEIVASLVIFGMLFSLPALSNRMFLGMATASSLGALLIIIRIHRSYVSQLGENLQTGRLNLGGTHAVDAATALTIAQSSVSTGREALLAEVKAFESRRKSAAAAPSVERPAAVAIPRPRAEPAGDTPDPSAGWLAGLHSGDVEHARRVLRVDTVRDRGASESLRCRLAAYVVPFLADTALAPDALAFLRERDVRIVGHLVDEILDPSASSTTRLRIAALLGGLRDPRAISGLWRGGLAAEFEVRFACGRAAVRLVSREPALAPPRAEILARVDRELGVSDERWLNQGVGLTPESASRPVLVPAERLGRISPSVEHVFNLLSLAHGRQMMASALAGVASTDAALHGTALEYLESVLPNAYSKRLFLRLNEGVVAMSRRTPEEVERQLLESAADFLDEPDSGRT